METYTTKQFARLFDVNEPTIRYYTNLGLLPCLRDENNQRIFNETSVRMMKDINCLKYCGASLEDIKEYYTLCQNPCTKQSLEERHKFMLKLKDQAKERMEMAKSSYECMEWKVNHIEEIIEGKIPDDTNPYCLFS